MPNVPVTIPIDYVVKLGDSSTRWLFTHRDMEDGQGDRYWCTCTVQTETDGKPAGSLDVLVDLRDALSPEDYKCVVGCLEMIEAKIGLKR